MSTDRIYSSRLKRVGDFVFDEKVAEVFPDMISRSVPGYASVITLTVEMAEYFALPGSHIYDLGCSLGATTLPMSERVPEDVTIYAVDSSAAMVRKLKQRLSSHQAQTRIEVLEEDLINTQLSNASFVVMNFTMQFIPLAERDALVGRIAGSLRPGGAFVLSEKICFEDSSQQALITRLHHAFKRAHGYSELEIAQKRTALENTLVPETLDAHVRRLRGAGFSSVTPWFQCLNFASLVAIK